jgi:hypothetical protein
MYGLKPVPFNTLHEPQVFQVSGWRKKPLEFVLSQVSESRPGAPKDSSEIIPKAMGFTGCGKKGKE